jgi:hypothetical protein
MKKPYLIQRCTYEERGNTNLGTITQEYHPDYMGSAEFEFGAMFDSLKRMNDNINQYKISDYIVSGKQVWFFIRGEEEIYIKEYITALEKLIKEKYGILKETIKFPFYYDKKEIKEFKEREKIYKKKLKNPNYTSTPWENVWWDLENNLIFSFDINAVVNWPICLKNSIKYREEQKNNKKVEVK